MSAKSDYRWGKGDNGLEKDPVIDMMRTEAQRYGNLGPEQIEKLAFDSGLSQSTIKSWFFGDVRRPQNITCRFFWEALGCTVQVVRGDGSVVKERR